MKRVSIEELRTKFWTPSKLKKPRKRPVYEEQEIQKAFFRWLELQRPELRHLCFHIQNGGKKSATYGNHLKQQGVTPGVCDVFCSFPKKQFMDVLPGGSTAIFYKTIAHGLYIEFKSKTGKVSEAQKKFITSVNNRGYETLIARTLEEAIDGFKSYVALE